MFVLFLISPAFAAPTVCPVKTQNLRAGQTDLEFINPASLADDEAKHAAAEMRAPRPITGGGQLVVRVERLTLESADVGYQLLVVESGGHEALRLEPPPETPGVPIGSPYWRGLFVAELPVELAGVPLTVSVADKLMAARCTWAVDASGKVTRVK